MALWKWYVGSKRLCAASSSSRIVSPRAPLRDGEKAREIRYRVELRAEFFDVFNRHYNGGPNLNIGSSYFGHVTSVSGNRTGQLGARFEF